METWDLYDENRQLLNETMVRGHEVPPNRYHLVIHVCIINEQGQLLIQKRRDDKLGWPGAWDFSSGGSAIKGDHAREAAERETFEELGLEIDLSNQRPHFTINFENGFDDFFIVHQEVDIESLKFPTEEVEEVKWATKKEIHNMVKEGLFIPYRKSMVDFIFDMRIGFGTIDK
ncbi:NUDIX hydrolase [Mammaliicoccus vitulinus]|uniref:NUDIX hydrolase n=1 Tax=Mammaliicoccus vitulinus TaxID=71237 RepID=UPI0003062DE0|nr:NUDIX domain-containing protein [Mammaliicoccus vitulinus]